MSQHREVTRHFHPLAQWRARRLINVEPLLPGDPLINRCHHARFQDLLGRFADGSIQLLCVDPVYVFAHAGVYGARAARSLECDDADDAEAALATVIDLLRDWQRKLAVGGVVLLWQPWQPLLSEITAAAGTYGWEVEGPVIWDKKRTQPGRFDSAYSPQGEFLWLLHRPQERMVNHADDPSREMILRYAPVSSPGSAHEQLHGFEKPLLFRVEIARLEIPALRARLSKQPIYLPARSVIAAASR